MKLILIILFPFLMFAQDMFLLYGDDGVGYDAETTAWETRVIANSGTVSDATLAAVDNFVLAITDIRSKLVRVNLICGDNLSSMFVPLFYNSDGSGTPVGEALDSSRKSQDYVGGDYSESTGLTGAASKWLQTGLTPDATAELGLNDTHFSIALGNDITTSTQYVIGTGSNFTLYPHYTGDVFYFRVNASANGSDVSLSSVGFWLASRLVVGTEFLYKNGVEVDEHTRNSHSESSTEILLINSIAYELVGYTIGKGLTPSEQLVLHNALETFNDALSRGVVP